MMQVTNTNKRWVVKLVLIVLLVYLAFYLFSQNEYQSEGKGEIVIKKNKQETSKAIYASINGSAYYFGWCGSNVNEENKIYFRDSEQARAWGYRKAKNC